MEQLLTLTDVVDRLKVTRNSITNWVKAGTFPKPVFVGSLKRWRTSDIERYLNGETNPPQPAQPKQE